MSRRQVSRHIQAVPFASCRLPRAAGNFGMLDFPHTVHTGNTETRLSAAMSNFNASVQRGNLDNLDSHENIRGFELHTLKASALKPGNCSP